MTQASLGPNRAPRAWVCGTWLACGVALAAYVVLGTRGWLEIQELPAAWSGALDSDRVILARGLLFEGCGVLLATFALGHVGGRASSLRAALGLEALVLLGAVLAAWWGLIADPGSRFSPAGFLMGGAVGAWPVDPWAPLGGLALLAAFVLVPWPAQRFGSIPPMLVALSVPQLFAPLLGVTLLSRLWSRSALAIPAAVLGLGALWLALDPAGAPGPGSLTLALLPAWVPLGIWRRARRRPPEA